jgi:hypothetical protein
MPPAIVVNAGVYVVTGVASSVAHQYLIYNGLTEPSTLIMPMCTYLGMFLVILVPESYFSSQAKRKEPKKQDDEAASVTTSDGANGEADGEGDDDSAPLLSPAPQARLSPEKPRPSDDDVPELTHPSVSPSVARKSQNASLSSSSVSAPVTTASSSTSAAATTATSLSPSMLQRLGVKGVLFTMVMLDFVGTYASLVGMQMCGSGLHTVVMSGVVCWSALLSVVVLRKKTNAPEVASLALIFLGLMCSAFAQGSHGSAVVATVASVTSSVEALDLQQVLVINGTMKLPADAHPTTTFEAGVEVGFEAGLDHGFDHGAKAMHQVFVGILITTMASWFFAFNYICAETMHSFKSAPSSKFVCEKIGLYDLLLSLVYMAFYTLPNWHTLVSEPVAKAEGDPLHLLLIGAFSVVSASCHMVSYWWIIKNSGAVTVGVVKSLQAISAFAVSAFLFCEQQSSQCYTQERGMSTILVCAGVTAFSWNKSKAGAKKKGKKKRAKGRVGEEDGDGVIEMSGGSLGGIPHKRLNATDAD